MAEFVGRTFAAATWTELEPHWEGGLGILPLGATEQHGPHLPLDTDTRIATAIAASAVESLNDPAIFLFPALPYGASGEHAGFPGTISIGTDALGTLIVEIARSVIPPLRALVIVSGHGGNADALRLARTTLQEEARALHLWTPHDVPVDLHAGAHETSLLLHLAPEVVRLDQISDGPDQYSAAFLAELRERGVRELSPTGVLGVPSQADAAQGAAIFTKYVHQFADYLMQLSP